MNITEQLFTESQKEKLADVMVYAMKVARAKKFKKGDIIRVMCALTGWDIADMIQARLLDDGFHPLLKLIPPSKMETTFYEHARDFQLSYLDESDMNLVRRLNGYISLRAPECLDHLKQFSRQVQLYELGSKPYNDEFYRRVEAKKLGWTLTVLPTNVMAEQAGLTLRQYTDQMIRACYLDAKDPVVKWGETMDNINWLIKKLN